MRPEHDKMYYMRKLIFCLLILAVLLSAIAAWQRFAVVKPGENTSWEDITGDLFLMAGNTAHSNFPQAAPSRRLSRTAPPIPPGATAPHNYFGPCTNCHKILRQAQTLKIKGIRVAASTNKIKAQEGHWQGMEVIPLTPLLARQYEISPRIKGVLIDDLTLASASTGLFAGDVIIAINHTPTQNLQRFVAATKKIAFLNKAQILATRGERQMVFELIADSTLGQAQLEGAPMILPGSIAPHRYQGACTKCHQIGSTGQLALDQGDLLANRIPAIRRNAKAPHRARGRCRICHEIQ